MFRNVFRSHAAAAAIGASAAAFAGSSYISGRNDDNTDCEKNKADDASTVVGLLQGLSESVKRMESTLGTTRPSPDSSNQRHGIDVVLGAQWGDEGKGKLVDMLSQVSGKR